MNAKDAADRMVILTILDHLLIEYGPKKVKDTLEQLLVAAEGTERYYDFEGSNA